MLRLHPTFHPAGIAGCLATALAGCGQLSLAPEPGPLHIAQAAAAPAPWEVIGASREGRALEAHTHGEGPLRVYLIAGIHGDEAAGVENAGRMGLLFQGELPSALTLRLMRDVNPDGTVRRVRTNAHGVDLNRNWPARNFLASPHRGSAPLSEPEVAAVHADLVRFAPQVVVVLHAARRGPFVNFDGPARELAQVFVEAAAHVDDRWYAQSDIGYATPGSLGSLIGVDWGLPILTVELDRGQDGEQAWPALRAGLAALLDTLAAEVADGATWSYAAR